MTEEPESERASAADVVKRSRTAAADAVIAGRRTLERLGLARLVLVTAGQVVIVVILWRVSVRRARSRRRHAEAWLNRD